MIDRERHGDLTDLIARPHAARGTVSVGPGDSLATAQKRMRDHQVSQLPVIEDGLVIGIVSDRELMDATAEGPDAFARSATEVMRDDYPRLYPEATREELLGLLRDETYVVVRSDDRFHGLITRSDVITGNRNEI